MTESIWEKMTFFNFNIILKNKNQFCKNYNILVLNQVPRNETLCEALISYKENFLECSLSTRSQKKKKKKKTKNKKKNICYTFSE